MKFVPDAVLGMAQTMEPAAAATQAHARQILDVGFDPTHAGQDYGVQGAKLAAGVDGIVTMLQSWSQASDATVGVFRQAVTVVTATEERNRAQVQAPAHEAGPA